MRRMHAAFGCFTLCGRYLLGLQYLYQAFKTKARAKQVTCKTCKRIGAA